MIRNFRIQVHAHAVLHLSPLRPTSSVAIWSRTLVTQYLSQLEAEQYRVFIGLQLKKVRRLHVLFCYYVS